MLSYSLTGKETVSRFRSVFLKLIWPAAPFSAKKILSAPPPPTPKRSIFTFITHRCNETFKLKFKLFIKIHCCKIQGTNKKKYNNE